MRPFSKSRPLQTIGSLGLLLALLLQSTGTKAMAQEAADARSKSSTGKSLKDPGRDYLAMVPTPPPMAEGADFIQKMQAAADSYQDYYFEYKMTAFKHGTVVEEGKLWFKKPRLLRLEETGEYKHGCTAILTSSGKVKAKAGGALGVFTVDLAPQNSMLRSANGYPMVLSDLSSLAAALRKFLAEGKTAKVSQNTLQISSQPQKVYILEIYQNPNNQIYKRVAVDSTSLLPVEWWDFESAKLVSHSIWKTFRGNIALSNTLFEDVNRK
jgi:outer membrane lipoprotein-sorting protein